MAEPKKAKGTRTKEAKYLDEFDALHERIQEDEDLSEEAKTRILDAIRDEVGEGEDDDEGDPE